MGDQILKAAQMGGIIGAAFLSGYISCFSLAGVTTLNVAPVDVLVKEFKVMYKIGSSTSPFMAMAVMLCNVLSAYRSRRSSQLVGGVVSHSALYMAAALSVLCIVPYTGIFMEPVVNKKLLELGSKAENGVKVEELLAQERDIRETLVRWKGMNFVRAGLVGLGALLATVSTLP